MRARVVALRGTDAQGRRQTPHGPIRLNCVDGGRVWNATVWHRWVLYRIPLLLVIFSAMGADLWVLNPKFVYWSIVSGFACVDRRCLRQSILLNCYPGESPDRTLEGLHGDQDAKNELCCHEIEMATSGVLKKCDVGW
jgi:hypothetical protein